MSLRLLYLIFWKVLGLVLLSCRTSSAKDIDQAGFVADHDHRVSEDLRFVQLTPPGSACSVAIGEGVTSMTRVRSRACR